MDPTDATSLDVIRRAVVPVNGGSGFLVTDGESVVIATAGHAANRSEEYRDRARILGTAGLLDLAFIRTSMRAVTSNGHVPVPISWLVAVDFQEAEEVLIIGFPEVYDPELVIARTAASSPCTVPPVDIAADLQRDMTANPDRDMATRLLTDVVQCGVHVSWPRARYPQRAKEMDHSRGFERAGGMSGGPMIVKVNGVHRIAAIALFENTPFDSKLDRERYERSDEQHCIIGAPIARWIDFWRTDAAVPVEQKFEI